MKNIFNLLRQLNHNNATPLHYVAMKNSIDIGKILISKEAEIDAKDISFQKSQIVF